MVEAGRPARRVDRPSPRNNGVAVHWCWPWVSPYTGGRARRAAGAPRRSSVGAPHATAASAHGPPTRHATGSPTPSAGRPDHSTRRVETLHGGRRLNDRSVSRRPAASAYRCRPRASAAGGAGPQHCLYLRPDPHQHESLRPGGQRVKGWHRRAEHLGGVCRAGVSARRIVTGACSW